MLKFFSWLLLTVWLDLLIIILKSESYTCIWQSFFSNCDKNCLKGKMYNPPFSYLYIIYICIYLKYKRYISWSLTCKQQITNSFELHIYLAQVLEKTLVKIFTVLTNIHKYKNINYTKILTAFEKMLVNQMHWCLKAL